MADQRKRTSSSGGSRKPKASSRSAAAKKGAASKSKTTRRAAASKAGKASGRKRTASKTANRTAKAATPRKAAAPAADMSGKSVAEFRDALSRNVFRPLEMVLITRDRIQEVVDDAVQRGRMTADDADEVVRGLVERGRRQTDDVLGNLETLLDRGTKEVRRGAGAAERARRQVGEATTRAGKRALGAAGIGSGFPIGGYDDLTAAQVQGRLGSLSPAELRKVRDYERRNANRKSVLSAIESKLS